MKPRVPARFYGRLRGGCLRYDMQQERLGLAGAKQSALSRRRWFAYRSLTPALRGSSTKDFHECFALVDRGAFGTTLMEISEVSMVDPQQV